MRPLRFVKSEIQLLGGVLTGGLYKRHISEAYDQGLCRLRAALERNSDV